MKKVIANLNFQPNSLTERELEDPKIVLLDFFENHPIHETRETVWELYKAWVNHMTEFTDGKSNADMLFFYTQLIDFLNASYLQIQKS
jgi:hypothetical protein